MARSQDYDFDGDHGREGYRKGSRRPDAQMGGGDRSRGGQYGQGDDRGGYRDDRQGRDMLGQGGRAGFGTQGFGYGPDRGYDQRSGQGYGGGGQGDGRGFLDKAGDEVSSWFGDRDAERRCEADHRGKGPKGYARSDDRIRDEVNDRLTDDPMIDASDIEVAVADGEVTLSGEVDSRPTRRRAEDCVDRIAGVKHVQNNIRVKSQTGMSARPGDMASAGGGSVGGSSGMSSGGAGSASSQGSDIPS